MSVGGSRSLEEAFKGRSRCRLEENFELKGGRDVGGKV